MSKEEIKLEVVNNSIILRIPVKNIFGKVIDYGTIVYKLEINDFFSSDYKIRGNSNDRIKFKNWHSYLLWLINEICVKTGYDFDPYEKENYKNREYFWWFYTNLNTDLKQTLNFLLTRKKNYIDRLKRDLDQEKNSREKLKNYAETILESKTIQYRFNQNKHQEKYKKLVQNEYYDNQLFARMNDVIHNHIEKEYNFLVQDIESFEQLVNNVDKELNELFGSPQKYFIENTRISQDSPVFKEPLLKSNFSFTRLYKDSKIFNRPDCSINKRDIEFFRKFIEIDFYKNELYFYHSLNPEYKHGFNESQNEIINAISSKTMYVTVNDSCVELGFMSIKNDGFLSRETYMKNRVLSGLYNSIFSDLDLVRLNHDTINYLKGYNLKSNVGLYNHFDDTDLLNFKMIYLLPKNSFFKHKPVFVNSLNNGSNSSSFEKGGTYFFYNNKFINADLKDMMDTCFPNESLDGINKLDINKVTSILINEINNGHRELANSSQFDKLYNSFFKRDIGKSKECQSRINLIKTNALPLFMQLITLTNVKLHRNSPTDHQFVISKTKEKDNSEFGLLAEQEVYKYLVKNFSQNFFELIGLVWEDLRDENLKVNWINEGKETFYPYDIEVAHNDDKIFIDVKATRYESGNIFYLSIKELEFLLQNSSKYLIARVCVLGEGQEAIGARINSEMVVRFFACKRSTVEIIKANLDEWRNYYGENSIRFTEEHFEDYTFQYGRDNYFSFTRKIKIFFQETYQKIFDISTERFVEKHFYKIYEKIESLSVYFNLQEVKEHLEVKEKDCKYYMNEKFKNV